MDRNDYEENVRKNYVPPRSAEVPEGAIAGKIACIATVLERDSPVPIALAIRVEVDFLTVPIMCHLRNVQELDSVIECLIAARNHLWPEE